MKKYQKARRHLAKKYSWLIDCVIRIKGKCRMILAKYSDFSCFLILNGSLLLFLSLSPFWLPVSFSTGACNRLVRREEKARSLHLLTSNIASISILANLISAKLPKIVILPLLLPPSKASPTPIGFAILLLLHELRLVGRTFPPDI